MRHHPAPREETDITEDAYELLQRGRDLLSRRHAHQAAVVLERARTQARESGSVREALGRAYYAAGRYRAARDQFNEAVEHDPADDYGHFALGLSLIKTGEPARAIGHLRLAVAMRPHNQTYRRTLHRVTGQRLPIRPHGDDPQHGGPHSGGDTPDADAPPDADSPQDAGDRHRAHPVDDLEDERNDLEQDQRGED